MKRIINKGTVFTSFLCVCCTALWGVSTPIVKIEYRYVDSQSIASLLLLAGVQFIIAGLVTVFSYSIKCKKLMYPSSENLTKILWISLLQVVLQYGCLYIGMSHTTAVKASVLKSTDVFFVVLIACFILHQEAVSFKKILSCIIGFAGIIIVNLKGLSFDFNFKGDGMVLLAIVFYSVSVAVIKKWSFNEDPIVLSGYQMGLGGTILTVVGLVFHGKVDFYAVFPFALSLSLVYAVSYPLWTLLLKNNPASKVIIYSFTTPVFGVLFSLALLREKNEIPIFNLILAVLLICVGIILRVREDVDEDNKRIFK